MDVSTKLGLDARGEVDHLALIPGGRNYIEGSYLVMTADYIRRGVRDTAGVEAHERLS